MKIIINVTNTIEDRPLREVDRLITSGKGHLPAQGGLIPSGFSADLIPLHNDGDVIINSKQQEALIKFIEEKKDPDFTKITYEDLDELSIFREPSIEEVIDIDLVEPVPVDHYVDFESPKKMSLLKKLRNKII